MTPIQEIPLQEIDDVVIRFAGDSGDGMQLTGGQFTNTSALMGNDIATFPDFPAEIRAPVGTVFGVSGFQVRFSSQNIHTPGDAPDVLVAMNPAALKVNIGDLKEGGILIVNTGNFGPRDLAKAHYDTSPLEDEKLSQTYNLVSFDLNQATIDAVSDCGLTNKQALRCKNLLALGMLYYAYSRPLSTTEKWLKTKFAKKPEILEANLKALHAGFDIAENNELFAVKYDVGTAPLEKGTYRNIGGNAALAMGLVAGTQTANLNLFYASYPITPASDVLHALSRYKNYDVITFQAEDEIAAICSAIGASWTGALGVTGTSGPGLALKGEALGLSVMIEQPLIVVNVQRAGPSTGMPTKTEQADLNQAVFGRNGEAPIPVITCSTPADCFEVAIEAVRIAVTYMTPVLLLSDGYIGNGSEPFRIPDADDVPKIQCAFSDAEDGRKPFERDELTLARPWIKPGTPGLENRVGGLEKAENTGNVSYDPINHEKMVQLREEKINGIARTYAPLEVYGPEEGEVLVLGWGSTRGAIRGAVERFHREGKQVSHVHLRNIWPLPLDLGDILARFQKVVIPELNRGQLNRIIRSEYLVSTISLPKVQGKPYGSEELFVKIQNVLEA